MRVFKQSDQLAFGVKTLLRSLVQPRCVDQLDGDGSLVAAVHPPRTPYAAHAAAACLGLDTVGAYLPTDQGARLQESDRGRTGTQEILEALTLTHGEERFEPGSKFRCVLAQLREPASALRIAEFQGAVELLADRVPRHRARMLRGIVHGPPRLLVFLLTSIIIVTRPRKVPWRQAPPA